MTVALWGIIFYNRNATGCIEGEGEYEQMSKLTIQNIADLAGVNKATVSRVLNGNKNISEKTRLKIEKIMKEHNYVPNSIARGLAFNKTFTVGFCFDYTDKKAFANPFFYKVLQGIEDVIYDNEYLLLMMSDHDKKGGKSTFERIVVEHRVDGLLLPDTLLNQANYELLIEHEMPFVIIGEHSLQQEGIRWVDVDNVQAAGILTERLLALGHRSIVMYAGAADGRRDKFIADRMEGYRAVMGQHGLEAHIVEQADSLATLRAFEGGEAGNNGHNPEAVICCTHELLFEMLDWEHGNPMLKEISLATFDDYPMFRHLKHPVHYVEIDLEMMGKQAAGLLFSLINKEANPAQSIRIPTSIVN